jgi:hypothetical protein
MRSSGAQPVPDFKLGGRRRSRRGYDAPISAVVFGKPTYPEQTLPLRPTQLEAQIRDKLGAGAKVNSRDLQVVLFKEGCKNADNEFHRFQRDPDTHKYQGRRVIVQKILADSTHVTRARESYAARPAPSKNKRGK